MNPEPLLTDITHTIQLAIAPVFLLTAVGTTLSVFSQRLARIVDRARRVEAMLAAATPGRRRGHPPRAPDPLDPRQPHPPRPHLRDQLRHPGLPGHRRGLRRLPGRAPTSASGWPSSSSSRWPPTWWRCSATCARSSWPSRTSASACRTRPRRAARPGRLSPAVRRHQMPRQATRVAVLLVLLAVTAMWASSRTSARRARTTWERAGADRRAGPRRGLSRRHGHAARHARAAGPPPGRRARRPTTRPPRVRPSGGAGRPAPRRAAAASDPARPRPVARALHAFDLWRATRAAHAAAPGFVPGAWDVRVYLLAEAPGERRSRFAEGLGEQGGEVGVVPRRLRRGERAAGGRGGRSTRPSTASAPATSTTRTATPSCPPGWPSPTWSRASRSGWPS